ncbi:MAG: hypothetical protein ACTHMS_18200 [Jatrophihabitans sp.]|uniref:hypothetical protein n=1 Tax=Jatrophihabitans sp. TaxID=1932789 RepID=UPI003F7F5EBF
MITAVTSEGDEMGEGAGVTALTGEGRWTRARAAHRLGPVRHRWAWIAGGLALQLAAVGGIVAWLAERIKHDGLTGQALKATVLLVWHEMLMSRSGIAVLAVCGIVLVAGSMLAARPFVRSVTMLTVTVPLAAVVGLLALGAIVVVVAVVVVLAGALDNVGGGGGSSGSSRKQRAEEGTPQTL